MSIAQRLQDIRKDLIAVHNDLQETLKTDNTRKRGAINQQLFGIVRMLRPETPYTSQAGQDRIVERHFAGKTGLKFVDIGAYDGITGSNTAYLERHLGWKGVLVEPVKAQRDIATKARVAKCLPYAVADKKGTATFIEVTSGFTQMSGIEGTYDEKLLERVRADPRHKEKEVKVQTRSIAQILTEAKIKDPDFISLDIEGGELKALQKFPFSKHKVGMWAIENNAADPEIPKLMRENGYDLAEFCGQDEIYVKRK